MTDTENGAKAIVSDVAAQNASINANINIKKSIVMLDAANGHIAVYIDGVLSVVDGSTLANSWLLILLQELCAATNINFLYNTVPYNQATWPPPTWP